MQRKTAQEQLFLYLSWLALLTFGGRISVGCKILSHEQSLLVNSFPRISDQYCDKIARACLLRKSFLGFIYS